MGTRRLVSALIFAVVACPSSAITDVEERLSPYDQLDGPVSNDVNRDRLITPLSGLRAIYDPSGTVKADASNRMGNFLVVGPSELRTIRSMDITTDRSADLVAKDLYVGLDERNGERVLLTGNLIVKYLPDFDIEAVQGDDTLSLVKNFPAIRTAFFEILDHGALRDIEKSLRQNPSVVDVRMEQVQLGKRAR